MQKVCRVIEKKFVMLDLINRKYRQR
jgi:hypothetical protein